MTRHVVAIGEADYPQWDAYVRRSSQATLFHSTHWKQVVERTYGYPGFYLAVKDGDRISGALPVFLCHVGLTERALTALPFAATQPSVCADDDWAERLLMDAAYDLARQNDVHYIEIREGQEKSWDWPVKRVYVDIRLRLTSDPEEVWRTVVKGKARNQVRMARRNGLRAAWGGAAFLDRFYAIYTHTLHRLGSPPHAQALFRNVFAAYPAHTEIVLVCDGERPIAGAFVMRDDAWFGFPWAGSMADAHPLRPNHLLYWSIIERACAAGYAEVDMGRSTPGSGAMRFKMQWGGIAWPLWYYFGLIRLREPPSRDASSPMMMRAARLWRRLPQRVSTRLGPSLARRIP